MPGICTLINSLFYSIRVSNLNRVEEGPKWINEYLTGIDKEIYKITINENLPNLTFKQLSLDFYEKYEITIFGYSPPGKTIVLEKEKIVKSI